MQKKLTIAIDEKVYEGLHRVIGHGHITTHLKNGKVSDFWSIYMSNRFKISSCRSGFQPRFGVAPGWRSYFHLIFEIASSQFIESLVRPHVISQDLEAAYKQMTQDEAHFRDA